MGNASCHPDLKRLYPLPKKYKTLKVLGEGGFGVVLQCLDRETKELAAIKYAKECLYSTYNDEAFMLQVLMENNLDQKNIVKFHTAFCENRCLVFENLDISLYDYIRERQAPMRLQDIRTVIQQLATALDGLKSVGVIHADLKLDNIMLVDQKKQPFKVKLIDFGLAIFKSKDKEDRIFHQLHFFRAPEVIFALPVSEALDMWSLGCMMARMVLGYELFPARSNYELLKYIIDLLGLPPARIITDRSLLYLYFNKDCSNQWELKTPKSERPRSDHRSYAFRSLDEMKIMRLENNNATETDERSECIELLKAMLKWDGKERITPKGILSHPFITKSYLNRSSHLNCCNETDSSQAAETMMRADVDDKTCQRNIPTSGPIMVQPAPPHRRIILEKMPDEESISPRVSLVSNSEEDLINPRLSLVSVTDADFINQELSLVSVTDADFINPQLSLVSVTDEDFISPQLSLVSVTDEDFINPQLSLVSVTDEDFVNPQLSLVSKADEDPSAPNAENTKANNHPDHTGDNKSKKKKNCFKRFLSWIRRRVTCKVGDVAM